MHRTIRRPGRWLGGWLVALVLGGLTGLASAQTCTPEVKPVIVLLNGATRIQAASKKAIKTVTNPKEGILEIRTVDKDPTTVVLRGVQPGITRLEIEDTDGKRETREVFVQADVEYVTAQVRQAVPLGNIQVVPNGTNSVILTGYINRAEDAN